MVLDIRPVCVAEPSCRLDHSGPLVRVPVEMTEPTGVETVVLLRLANYEVLGRVAPDTRLAPGAPAEFAIDTRKLCLFNPVSEMLIG
ncbi:MAG: hypothetical protein M0002_14830 [Rhodospirillales bacterium]|nr:hypothetical protein [Rhodospirillales bacterium]